MYNHTEISLLTVTHLAFLFRCSTAQHMYFICPGEDFKVIALSGSGGQGSVLHVL